MRLIIDANILISALLKNNLTRELLIHLPFDFYSPDTLLESISKYKKELTERSGLSENDFETLLNFLLSKIKIFDQEDYSHKMEEAIQIMGRVDIDDADYIAIALATENDGIWSDDKHFQQQSKIKIFTTPNLVDLLNKEFS